MADIINEKDLENVSGGWQYANGNFVGGCRHKISVACWKRVFAGADDGKGYDGMFQDCCNRWILELAGNDAIRMAI